MVLEFSIFLASVHHYKEQIAHNNNIQKIDLINVLKSKYLRRKYIGFVFNIHLVLLIKQFKGANNWLEKLRKLLNLPPKYHIRDKVVDLD